ncbi:hypothetical protein [Bacillus sp. B-jedd]|uniref:hypothetical protein n=1 Tax=Bacillus sp. B-jedd TaxID=1476857 RepID=UPI0005156786|nr:hypothetical protein [Bacillus sp. B-jedd]CEG26990.1 hypothetical protein BN1002_01845 [Bacillus sp. B-jedd]
MFRLMTGLVLFLLIIPGFAAANGTFENSRPNVIDASKCGKGSCGHYEVHRELKEAEILTWVEKFTPEQAAEWKAMFVERKGLEAKWLSPEMKDKREAWKKERVKRLAEIKELKKQWAEGKMTREEYVEQAYEKMKRGNEKAMRGHAIYFRIKEAVENNDAKEAGSLLNELLEFHRQHNEKLKARIEK